MCDVTVFGDQLNDASMFQIAGRGVAVSNAVESIKGIAHQVIGDNESDAVVRYLEEIWVSASASR
jgi:hydroxymethylpyrimidine pyrophosphatase-like HAD family hydrolase